MPGDIVELKSLPDVKDDIGRVGNTVCLKSQWWGRQRSMFSSRNCRRQLTRQLRHLGLWVKRRPSKTADQAEVTLTSMVFDYARRPTATLGALVTLNIG